MRRFSCLSSSSHRQTIILTGNLIPEASDVRCTTRAKTKVGIQFLHFKITFNLFLSILSILQAKKCRDKIDKLQIRLERHLKRPKVIETDI